MPLIRAKAAAPFVKQLNGSMKVPLSILQKEQIVKEAALLDSRAQDQFIDETLATKLKLEKQKLNQEITVQNADGTENKNGKVTEYTWVRVTIGGHTHDIQFLITHISGSRIILGLPWLDKWNPSVNWKEQTVIIRGGKETRDAF